MDCAVFASPHGGFLRLLQTTADEWTFIGGTPEKWEVVMGVRVVEGRGKREMFTEAGERALQWERFITNDNVDEGALQHAAVDCSWDNRSQQSF